MEQTLENSRFLREGQPNEYSPMLTATRRSASASSSLGVLLLTADFAPGNWSGIGTAAHGQAAALARAGARVQVLWARPDSFPDYVTGDGVRVAWQSSTSSRVDPRRYDLIHLHSLALSELAWEMSRRFRLPLVHTCHSTVASELQAGQRREFWKSVQRFIFRHADRVVFVSPSERQLALEQEPSLAQRSVVIPNGVAGVRTVGDPTRFDRPAQLLYVGRFAATKGLPLLARTLARAQLPGDWNVTLAGGHGDARGTAAVEHLVQTLGTRCRVLGWCSRSRLDELYRQSTGLLVPSRYEPFGLVALEAMRQGCPVIARAVGGLKNIVQPGSGGVLIDSADSRVWAETVERLVRDGVRMRAMGQAGPKYVREKYSLDSIAQRLVSDAYQVALDNSAMQFRATTAHGVVDPCPPTTRSGASPIPAAPRVTP